MTGNQQELPLGLAPKRPRYQQRSRASGCRPWAGNPLETVTEASSRVSSGMSHNSSMDVELGLSEPGPSQPVLIHKSNDLRHISRLLRKAPSRESNMQGSQSAMGQRTKKQAKGGSRLSMTSLPAKLEPWPPEVVLYPVDVCAQNDPAYHFQPHGLRSEVYVKINGLWVVALFDTGAGATFVAQWMLSKIPGVIPRKTVGMTASGLSQIPVGGYIFHGQVAARTKRNYQKGICAE